MAARARTMTWHGQDENHQETVARVDRMTLRDVPEVMAIERDSFSAPWPSSAYRRELIENRMAHYFVLRLSSPIEPPEPAPAPALPGRRGFITALLPRAFRHEWP